MQSLANLVKIYGQRVLIMIYYFLKDFPNERGIIIMALSAASAFSKVWSVITTIFLIISSLINPGEISSSPEVSLISTNSLSMTNAMYAGQGITTDGEYYYTSGTMTAVNMHGLAKWDAETLNRLATKLQAIPDYFVEDYESNHIGGISYFNGYIYAAVEDVGNIHPLILLYDAETLEYADICYELGTEHLPNGVPWCAVDAQRELLYCSPFRDVTEIVAFNLNDLSFSHTIPLSCEITRIQGGEVYDTTLYLSYDAQGSVDEAVYAVNPDNGDVKTVFERYLNGYDNEAEGMTVYPMADGSLFHILDYDKLFSVNIRHYAWTEQE